MANNLFSSMNPFGDPYKLTMKNTGTKKDTTPDPVGMIAGLMMPGVGTPGLSMGSNLSAMFGGVVSKAAAKTHSPVLPPGVGFLPGGHALIAGEAAAGALAFGTSFLDTLTAGLGKPTTNPLFSSLKKDMSSKQSNVGFNVNTPFGNTVIGPAKTPDQKRDEEINKLKLQMGQLTRRPF